MKVLKDGGILSYGKDGSGKGWSIYEMKATVLRPLDNKKDD